MGRLLPTSPMEPRRSPPLALVLILGVGLASHGQDEKAGRPVDPGAPGGIAAGAVVVLTSPDLPLRGQGDDRFTVPRGTNLEVERIDGGWVLVASMDDGRRGWIGIDRVIALEKAMEHFDRALARDPRDVDSYRMRGLLRADRGEFDRAMADLDEAVRLAPDRAGVYIDRGAVQQRRGQFDRAIADYTRALRLEPREARAYAGRASAWREKHEYRAAIDDYSAAIALEPMNPLHYLLRGALWSRQGDHERAIADLDEAVRLAPDDAVAYISRAIEWEKDLQRDRALSDYQKAIALDPRAAAAYDGRGRIWRKNGEYEKVVANYAELARMVPDDPTGHREVAWILATCDRDAIRDGHRAVHEATVACKLTKWTDPGCLEALAAACAEVGEFDAAVGWQLRALDLFDSRNDKVDRRLVAKKRQDAQMSHRLYRYKKHLPYYERPDQAVR